MTYALTKTLKAASLDEALGRVRSALEREGFGILTDLDIGGVLREKAGTDIGAYRVLGACNPYFASEALEIEPGVGVMLPCNVVVRALDDGYEVMAVDPVAAMKGIGNHRLEILAGNVRDRLEWALAAAVDGPLAAPVEELAETGGVAADLADLSNRMKAFEERLSHMTDHFRRSGTVSFAKVETPASGPFVDELQRDMAALNGTFAHILDFLDSSERKSYASRHFG